jgi:uncharacterized protein involved in type VI secretion and phage assembly
MYRDTLPSFAIPPHQLGAAHLGRVTSVDDPERLARVKVELYALDTTRDAAVWARVASPFAGAGRGGFFIPQVDDEVVVVFVNNDARAPVVIGGVWNGNAKPPESINGKVDRWTIKGKAGTRIAIVEESDATAKIRLETPAGVTFTMTDEGGGKIEISCAGNTVTIDSSGIAFKAAAKFSVNATSFDASSGVVKFDCAMSSFSGALKCDTHLSNSVVSSAYTPGAGQVW